MTVIRRRVFVSGQVQGVSFRAVLVREVERLGEISGSVRNRSDGRVEAVFQGEASKVLQAVAWCRHGPESARVAGLEVSEETPGEELGPFSISRE